MPVIIDQLDIVDTIDTDPEATPPSGGSAKSPSPAADGSALRMIRLAAQRAARVRAD
jgi:hypothetical protein